jgi:hypothetical protein
MSSSTIAALMSEDPQVRDAAIRDVGEIVRAAHQAIPQLAKALEMRGATAS